MSTTNFLLRYPPELSTKDLHVVLADIQGLWSGSASFLLRISYRAKFDADDVALLLIDADTRRCSYV